MRVVVVRRHEEAPVHVGVPAWLEAQQLPQTLSGRAVQGSRSPIGDRITRQHDRRIGHDPEGLSRSVVVARRTLSEVTGRFSQYETYTAGGRASGREVITESSRRPTFLVSVVPAVRQPEQTSTGGR